MAAASTSDSHAPDDETLAVPVGGNALNPEGTATHNPDKLGAGTPSGTPSGTPESATAGEAQALDNDEIEDQATELTE